MRHVGEAVEKRTTVNALEVILTEKEEMTGMWKRWLDHEWYGEIVYYKLF